MLFWLQEHPKNLKQREATVTEMMTEAVSIEEQSKTVVRVNYCTKFDGYILRGLEDLDQEGSF
jgi:hypothetical protein